MARPIPSSNRDLQSIDRSLKILGDGRLGTFRVQDLPMTGIEPGTVVFVLDGIKDGEESGPGTGCPVYWDGEGWFRFSDDTAVVA